MSEEDAKKIEAADALLNLIAHRAIGNAITDAELLVAGDELAKDPAPTTPHLAAYCGQSYLGQCYAMGEVPPPVEPIEPPEPAAIPDDRS